MRPGMMPYGVPYPMAQGLRRPHFQAVPVSQAEKLAHQHTMQDDDASIWRDTSLRYGGYADEVGEFLTPYLGKVGQFAGYGISTGYVLADMLTTLPKQFKNASPEFSTAKKSWQTAKEALDLSIFHGVATLLIPPMLIGSVVEATGHLLEKPKQEPHFSAGNGKQVAEAIAKDGFSLRGALDKGLEKATAPIAPTTQKWAEKSLDYATKNIVTDGIYKKANKAVFKSKDALGWVANGCAKMAEGLNKYGFSFVVDKELVDKLKQNTSSIKSFTDFAAGDTKEAGKRKLANLMFLKPIPVAIGIGMVPLIAHPFDELMLKIQDWTIRPLIGKNKIIKDESGKYHSVRNPAFWGRKEHPILTTSRTGQLAPLASGVAAHSKKLHQAQFGVYQSVNSPFSTAGFNTFSAPVVPYSHAFSQQSQTKVPIQ